LPESDHHAHERRPGEVRSFSRRFECVSSADHRLPGALERLSLAVREPPGLFLKEPHEDRGGFKVQEHT
jgi:hypothetical protein